MDFYTRFLNQKKVLILLTVLSSFFAFSRTTVSVYAEPPTPIEIGVPDEFEDGNRCPALKTGTFSVCGRASTVVYNEESGGYQNAGAFVEGLTVAVYLGSKSLGLSDRNNTGEWGGVQDELGNNLSLLTGLYSYTETNVDGEFALPVPIGGGSGGYAYVAFFCGKSLVDLYMMDASSDVKAMKISVATPKKCSPYSQTNTNGIPAPPYVEYADRDPLECAGAEPGDPGLEPSADVSEELYLFNPTLDGTWRTPAGDWIEGADAFAATLPGPTELSRRDLEGFTDSWMLYSLNNISSINCGLSGCYFTGEPSDSVSVPSCDILAKCSQFPIPAECRAPGLDLASPYSWDEYIRVFVGLMGSIGGGWEGVPVCDGLTLGDFIDVSGNQYLNEEGNPVYQIEHLDYKNLSYNYNGESVNLTLPTSSFLNPYFGRYLTVAFEDRPSNDTYRNMTASEFTEWALKLDSNFQATYGHMNPEDIWGFVMIEDPCSANNPTEEKARVNLAIDVHQVGSSYTVEFTPWVAELPFKTCYKSRLPIDDTYSAQRANLIATNNIFYEEGDYSRYPYAPVVASVAAPGEIIGQNDEEEINPAVEMERQGRGYWHIGTNNYLCTGNAADFHTNFGRPFNEVRDVYDDVTYVDDSVKYGFPSGYKFSTIETFDPWQPNHMIAWDDGDRLKGFPIIGAVREGDDPDLWANFHINNTNWQANLCPVEGEYYTGSGGDGCCVEWQIYTSCDVPPGGDDVDQSCTIWNPYGGRGSCCAGLECEDREPTLIPGMYRGTCEVADRDEYYHEEYRYECTGSVGKVMEISSDITNHPVGDSTYGSLLMSTIVSPPMQTCADDGYCKVENTYILDTRAEQEYTGDPLQGYGLKITAKGAPGETYYMDQLRKSVTANFLDPGPDGDLNNSYILREGYNACSEIPEPPAPPNTGTVDLLPYMRGDGRKYHLDYCFDGNEGRQTVQTQFGECAGCRGMFFQVKDGQFETLYYDSDQIYRELDTSEGVNNFYTQNTGSQRGAVWIDRYMSSGDRTARNPFVQHYEDKNACTPLAGAQVGSEIIFYGRYPTYTFPNGMSLDNVIALGWDTGGTVQEYYFYALDYGLVGFWARGMGASFYAGEASDGSNLTRESISCYPEATLGELYFEGSDGAGCNNGGCVTEPPEIYEDDDIEFDDPEETPVAQSCSGADCDKCDPGAMQSLINQLAPHLSVTISTPPDVTNIDPVSIDAYQAAEEATGVPCAILAGHHFMEGSNNPTQSIKDGGALGDETLAENAIRMAKDQLILRAGNVSDWTWASMLGAISGYNGGGNSQVNSNNYPIWNIECAGVVCNSESSDPTNCCSREYIDNHGPYSIATTGGPSPAGFGWLGLGEPYTGKGWSDPYALNYYTSDYYNMRLQFPADYTHVFEWEKCGCEIDIEEGTGYCPDEDCITIPFTRSGVIPTALWHHQNGTLY